MLVCLGLYRCSRTGYASKFCLFHFLYFSSGITHFATASVGRVVMDFFINQGASKLFIDFCFVLLKSGTRGGGLYLRACVPTALELIQIVLRGGCGGVAGSFLSQQIITNGKETSRSKLSRNTKIKPR